MDLAISNCARQPLLRSAYDQPDAVVVLAQLDRAIGTLAARLPAVAEHLEDAHEDVLAFTAYPKIVSKQLRSNSPNKR